MGARAEPTYTRRPEHQTQSPTVVHKESKPFREANVLVSRESFSEVYSFIKVIPKSNPSLLANLVQSRTCVNLYIGIKL